MHVYARRQAVHQRFIAEGLGAFFDGYPDGRWTADQTQRNMRNLLQPVFIAGYG